MKKINNILTNYFSVNLLSILGNLSLLILLFYIFIVYPLATSNLPNDVDSFDENGNFKTDTNGNDVKPQQVELYSFRNNYFKDDMGYVT